MSPVLYKAYYARRAASPSGLNGGVYYTEDFRLDQGAPQPHWVKKNTGLPIDTYDIALFRADPFDPVHRQYVKMSNYEQEIYARNTHVDDAWHKILDRSTARDLIGDYWPAGLYYDIFSNLEWIAPDRFKAGRLWSLWSNVYIPPTGDHKSYYLWSDDYGATWNYDMPVPPMYWAVAPARGVQCIEAATVSGFWGEQAHIVIGSNYTLLPFNHAITWRVAPFNPISEEWFGSAPVGYSGSGPGVRINPYETAAFVLHHYGYGFELGVNRDLYRDGARVQDALDLASSMQNRSGSCMNPDNMWFDPTDPLHQRIQADGRIYVTHDAWATVDDAAPPQINQSVPTFFACLVSPDDRPDTMQMTSSYGAHVWTFFSETDIDGERRDGPHADDTWEDSIPNDGGEPVMYGLWVGLEDTSGIYVYAVEMGDVGVEHGIPLHGDRSAWDVDGFPDEHASDIAHGTPHYHAPLPGAIGDVLTSDGTVWISTSPTSVTAAYWEPLTNGDSTSPELVFTADGDVIMVPGS